MPLLPAIPPQRVPIDSGFDYVTVDAQRRRVYAAHTGSQALLIVDADTGHILGQVKVGPLHGVAVDPATGHVFTGDGESRTVSEVDPESKAVLRSAAVDGNVDAIAYDPSNGHIYADEDDGTRIFVVDAKTMKAIGTVAAKRRARPAPDGAPRRQRASMKNAQALGRLIVLALGIRDACACVHAGQRGADEGEEDGNGLGEHKVLSVARAQEPVADNDHHVADRRCRARRGLHGVAGVEEVVGGEILDEVAHHSLNQE